MRRKVGPSLILFLIILPTLILILFLASCTNTIDKESEVAQKIIPEIDKGETTGAEQNKQTEKYPWHENIIATIFWAGEEASEENAWIANDDSTWDEQWMEHFGGVDNPEGRNFIPKENPYYFALPYTDFDENGRKQNIKKVYWYEQYQDRLTDTSFSIIKNRWAEIKNKEKDKTCYGQWEDAGPSEYDDTDYVFGTAQPKYDVGIDLSPDLAKCLGIDGKIGRAHV